MNRRSFLALAPLILVPEPRRVYSFMPGNVPWPYGARVSVTLGAVQVMTFPGGLPLTLKLAGNGGTAIRWPGGSMPRIPDGAAIYLE